MCLEKVHITIVDNDINMTNKDFLNYNTQYVPTQDYIYIISKNLNLVKYAV